VAIARALANDPPILVADEPTGNLDSATAEAVIRLFDELVAAGKTIVMVTHDREIASHARRTVHMVDGHLLDGMLPDEPTGPGSAAPGAVAGDPREPARA
jgi:putative ABC transport system ATP-binding protein